MPPTFRSDLYELVNLRMDGGLDEHVTRGLAAGKSWRVLAREVGVSHEALRSWFVPEQHAAEGA